MGCQPAEPRMGQRGVEGRVPPNLTIPARCRVGAVSWGPSTCLRHLSAQATPRAAVRTPAARSCSSLGPAASPPSSCELALFSASLTRGLAAPPKRAEAALPATAGGPIPLVVREHRSQSLCPTSPGSEVLLPDLSPGRGLLRSLGPEWPLLAALSSPMQSGHLSTGPGWAAACWQPLSGCLPPGLASDSAWSPFGEAAMLTPLGLLPWRYLVHISRSYAYRAARGHQHARLGGPRPGAGPCCCPTCGQGASPATA